MRIRALTVASASLVVLLLAGESSRAGPFEDLQQGARLFEQYLTQDQTLHLHDQQEAKLEAQDDFFPETGTGTSRRGGQESSAGGQFVRVMVNGVSYDLTDVPFSAWFGPYVRDVADRGIVSGYRNAQGVPTGIFGPERPVSIEELAKMTLEAAGADISSCPEFPKNLAAQLSWSSRYIACAEQQSLAVYADGTVEIGRPATRAEVVMTVLQGFGATFRDSAPAGIALKDVSASTLFSSAIFTALQDGIVAGYADAAGNPTGLFGPGNPVNRAEVSKIVSLAIQVYGN
jgi:hypothetical protein